MLALLSCSLVLGTEPSAPAKAAIHHAAIPAASTHFKNASGPAVFKLPKNTTLAALHASLHHDHHAAAPNRTTLPYCPEPVPPPPRTCRVRSKKRLSSSFLGMIAIVMCIGVAAGVGGLAFLKRRERNLQVQHEPVATEEVEG
jgi:hypothetical protein